MARLIANVYVKGMWYGPSYPDHYVPDDVVAAVDPDLVVTAVDDGQTQVIPNAPEEELAHPTEETGPAEAASETGKSRTQKGKP